MSTVEVVSPWISGLEPAARSPRLPGEIFPGQERRVPELQSPAPGRIRVGAFSLRQIVGGAVAQAEGEAIRRALGLTQGNKSQAARLLRTNYTTLHAKMRRYGISAKEFKA